MKEKFVYKFNYLKIFNSIIFLQSGFFFENFFTDFLERIALSNSIFELINWDI